MRRHKIADMQWAYTILWPDNAYVFMHNSPNAALTYPIVKTITRTGNGL